MCLLFYKRSCCECLIINQVVLGCKISNKWGPLLQPVACGRKKIVDRELNYFCHCHCEHLLASVKTNTTNALQFR